MNVGRTKATKHILNPNCYDVVPSVRFFSKMMFVFSWIILNENVVETERRTSLSRSQQTGEVLGGLWGQSPGRAPSVPARSGRPGPRGGPGRRNSARTRPALRRGAWTCAVCVVKLRLEGEGGRFFCLRTYPIHQPFSQVMIFL